MSRFSSRTGERVRWRVIVRTAGSADGSRGPQSLAWHLAECVDATRASAHCSQGEQLLATTGDPDGHCLVDGVCPRCEMASVAVSPAPLATVSPTGADLPTADTPEAPTPAV